MIIRQNEPANLETPAAELHSYLTPVESFYVRSHFSIPSLDSASYQLQVDGAVRHPFVLTLAELQDLPSITVTATLECAGNSRVFLVPQVQGAQWGVGAVGNAEWTGTLLSTVLQRAELADDACDIIFEGADCGTPKEEPVPPEPIAYARSIPCAAPVRSEILLAYRMNGEDLPPEHGYPVRVIVPGYYGMASVKWLTHVHVTREPFAGYFQTSDYAFWDALDGKPVRRPLGRMRVKSEIIQPAASDSVPVNHLYTVRGLAWSGEGDVTTVELSDDAGRTWHTAEFLDSDRRNCWRRWHWPWRTPSRPGRYRLMSRATDSAGQQQPAKHDPCFGTYVANHHFPIEVIVRECPGERQFES